MHYVTTLNFITIPILAIVSQTFISTLPRYEQILTGAFANDFMPLLENNSFYGFFNVNRVNQTIGSTEYNAYISSVYYYSKDEYPTSNNEFLTINCYVTNSNEFYINTSKTDYLTENGKNYRWTIIGY